MITSLTLTLLSAALFLAEPATAQSVSAKPGAVQSSDELALVQSSNKLAPIQSSNEPEAESSAIVQSGKTRFTVLTDRLIRMEWSEDGIFEDHATLAIVNRKLSVPSFSVNESDGVIRIKTPKLTLTYSGKGEKFSEDNLCVTFKLNGKTQTWYPGKSDEGNLMGTARTLDGCYALKDKRSISKMSWNGVPWEEDLCTGVLSRDGWAIVDESNSQIFVPDGSSWGSWVAERPQGDRLDLYIFAYGHDYTAALQDYSKVAGCIPMPPRYSFGYWWSRYWAYTDDEMLDIASQLRSHEVPADVFIVDMDWHLTWKDVSAERGNTDEFGNWIGWTGYSWNHSLIRNPEGFLHDLHKMDYKVALNLHPASGIRPYEDQYRDFVDEYLSLTDDYDGPKDYIYGSEPYRFAGVENPCGKEGYAASVPYRMDQKAWADAYFDKVIRPFERQGVDFWWLDWQQWLESRYVKGLSNTFWINRSFFTDKLRQNASLGKAAPRPFIYHRWGGLGSHRYPLGFSGDIYDEWDALKMLPYFTSTASNVLYCYWGHDIGGHMQREDHYTDPEMFTRWLQFGVFTPIFKTHSTASAYLERRIWAFPTHYAYMKKAIELRYALSPYIYTAAREAYESGVGLCRPMYYSYPERNEAYNFNEQYMFGDRILASVICTPADSVSGKALRQVWLPAGNDWYDMGRHSLEKGGGVKTFAYAIDQNPWFVKAGSVVPLAAEGIQNLQNLSDSLRLLVVPGSASSEYILYEDDGVSQAYAEDFATTKISKRGDVSSLTLEIAPRQGSYEGMSPTRQFTIILEGRKAAPKKVSLNGKTTECAYRISEHGVEVILPETDAAKSLKLQIR